MEDYKIRVAKEYQELKEKYKKLHKMLIKNEAGTLKFKLNCPIYLLERQYKAMEEYLHALEIRAEIENIDLNFHEDTNESDDKNN